MDSPTFLVGSKQFCYENPLFFLTLQVETEPDIQFDYQGVKPLLKKQHTPPFTPPGYQTARVEINYASEHFWCLLEQSNADPRKNKKSRKKNRDELL